MDERERFEAWAMGEFELAALPTRDGEGYRLIGVDDAWVAWQTSWQAARRTTPDREAVIAAAQRLVRDALDDVRVHPCDEHNDEMRSNGLSELMYGLYAALQTTATTPPRDTLIEEIAEMVDHMGEGRRLEEYVGAIREMKSGDKGGA